MKKITKKSVLDSLTDQNKEDLLSHFNSIYEVDELTDHEYNQIYLSWLWANGYVYQEENSMHMADESRAEFNYDNYEITIEADEPGGFNLNLNYDFYDFDKIIELMGWQKQDKK